MTIKDLCPTKSSGTKSKSIIVNALHTHWVHFLNVFLFLAGPEGLGRKTFKIWTRYESAARNENHGSIILCVAVLVIDCYSYRCVKKK